MSQGFADELTIRMYVDISERRHFPTSVPAGSFPVTDFEVSVAGAAGAKVSACFEWLIGFTATIFWKIFC